MKYAVCIVPSRHSEAFREAAEAVHDSLLELGHDAILTAAGPAGINPSRTAILFGWNLLQPHEELPKTTILYNLEQAGSHWLDRSRIDCFLGHQWWDWTHASTAQLLSQGHLATYVPIGYSPGWDRIGPPQVSKHFTTAEKCIDVLFYGSMNVRRDAMMKKLEAALGHTKVCWLYGKYGKERDDYIAHSKLVLNMHYHDPNSSWYRYPPLEICRVGYLLANRALVLSERSSESGFLEDVVEFQPEYQLVRRAVEIVRNHSDEERQAVANLGWESFKRRTMTEILRPIVGVGEKGAPAA